MELYLIRHGETDWNRQKRMQGQTDIPLNEYGRELARITAAAISDIDFDIVYSSPLIRAKETAQILIGNKKLDIITDERLKEISFGNDEGVPSVKLRADFSSFFFEPEKFIPSEGGESYEDLCSRTKDFLTDRIYPLKNTSKKVLIVAHGALNKSIILNLKNLPIKDIWTGAFCKNLSLYHYEINSDGLKVIDEARVYYEE